MKTPANLRAKAANLYERAKRPGPTEDPLSLVLQAMALEREADELERKQVEQPVQAVQPAQSMQQPAQQQQQVQPKKSDE
jgi:hypothetical protein